ncbi:MAG: ATP-binding protein [Candidatus Nanopelagicus sp.]
MTVKNEGQFANNIATPKVLVNSIEDIQFLNGEQVSEKVEAAKETEEDAMNRIGSRFAVLDEMSRACIAGDIRAMIVSGPPGVGKSHGVSLQMEKASMFDKITGKRPRFEIVKGAMSGIGLFATLYKYSDSKNVLVFDDCDVWEDQDALNVLKGALDSGKTRRISWNKDSRILREEGIPNTFNFNGSVIFITNLNFSDKRSNKIKAHLDALQSRCHYLDLTIDTERDKMLRIKQVHRDADGGLFVDYDFTQEQADTVIEFMWDNHTKLREVSLRMALKVADLVKISPNNWRELAKATCMRK